MKNSDMIRNSMLILMNIIKKSSSTDYSLYVAKTLIDELEDDKNITNNILIRFSLQPDIEELLILDPVNSLSLEDVEDFIVDLYRNFIMKFDETKIVKKEIIDEIKIKMTSRDNNIVDKLAHS